MALTENPSSRGLILDAIYNKLHPIVQSYEEKHKEASKKGHPHYLEERASIIYEYQEILHIIFKAQNGVSLKPWEHEKLNKAASDILKD